MKGIRNGLIFLFTICFTIVAPSIIHAQIGGSQGLLSTSVGVSGLGNVSVNLLSEKTTLSDTGESVSTQGGLLEIGISDSALLGNVNVGVLSGKEETQTDGQVSSGSLATIEMNNLLGDTHIGIVEVNETVNGNTTKKDGSLVNVELNDSPLVDTTIKIGGSESITTKPTITNPSDNSDPTDITFPEKKPEGNEPKLDGPGTGLPVNGENAIITKSNVNSGDGILNVTLGTDADDTDTISFPFFKNLLSNRSENDSSELITIINNLNENANHSLSLALSAPFVSSPTPSNSGSGSGSGSGGAFNLGGGSGVAAYLNLGCLNEVTMTNQLHCKLREITNQWTTGPPAEPPKNSFFLS